MSVLVLYVLWYSGLKKLCGEFTSSVISAFDRSTVSQLKMFSRMYAHLIILFIDDLFESTNLYGIFDSIFMILFSNWFEWSSWCCRNYFELISTASVPRRPDMTQSLFYPYPQITAMPKLAIPTALLQHWLIRFT